MQQINLHNTLLAVKSFAFLAKSIPPSQMRWNKSTSGITNTTMEDNKIFFIDVLSLTNTQTIDKKMWVIRNNLIEFWHYRHDNYLHVFDMQYDKDFKKFNSIAPHICNKDLYSGSLIINDNSLTFNLLIQSEIKNEEISYIYYPN